MSVAFTSVRLQNFKVGRESFEIIARRAMRTEKRIYGS
jgi:hypothetical protein